MCSTQQQGEQAQQPEPGQRRDLHDIEQPVVCGGADAQGHTPSVALGVAHRDERSRRLDGRLAVDGDRELHRPETRELHDQREVVAQHAVRPAQPVGAIADLRIESEGGDRQEGVGSPRRADLAHIYRARHAGRGELGRGDRVAARQTEGSSEVVAGARRNQDDGDAGLAYRVEDAGQRAVASDDDEHARALMERLCHQDPTGGCGLSRIHPHVHASGAQMRECGLGLLRSAPLSGERVRQHRDVLGHVSPTDPTR